MSGYQVFLIYAQWGGHSAEQLSDSFPLLTYAAVVRFFVV